MLGKSKATENNTFEEIILKELQEIKPKNDVKSDKIESFTKYVEASLRSMTLDASRRVMQKISTLLFEEEL